MKIGKGISIFGIIGSPLKHSLSPHIHNAGFRALRLNAVYHAFEVEDVEGAIRGMRAFGIKGLSVTIPHKTAVMEFLNEIDPIARKVGAVNTIINEDDVLKGYNTDVDGVIGSFKKHRVPIKGKRIFIIGSGGAARAVVFSLLENGASKFNISGIIPDEMSRLMDDMKRNYKGVDVTLSDPRSDKISEIIRGYDILVNCSPVGMWPDVHSTPISPDSLIRHHVVFDVVYNPVRTRLLKSAERIGCKVIPGVDMFLFQAYAQFKLFIGKKAPSDVMKRILMRHLKE